MFEAFNSVTMPDWVAGVCLFLAIGIAFVTGLKRPECTVRSPIVSTLVLLSAGFVLGVYANQSLGTQHAETKDKTFREEAWARFKKLCNENAGEKIYRTVDNVDGIFLATPRHRPTEAQLRDQYWMGDPYGYDGYGKAEVAGYLYGLNKGNHVTAGAAAWRGYEFAEMRNADDGSILRYYRNESTKGVRSVVASERLSRFEVRSEDISTRDDRMYWIAGSRLQVIELSTGEVLGERTGYLIEPGFGSAAGGRRPWLHARLVSGRLACPPIPRNVPVNRLFVDKVLRPSKGVANGQ